MMSDLKEKILRNIVKKAAKVYYDTIYAKKKKLEYIPPSGKLLGFEELSNMIDASLDMWLTTGRFNLEFEEKFAQFYGVKHCLTTNSGSSANLLALSALTSYKLGDRQVKKGDEVITVAAGFPTTIDPIVHLGLVPVVVDCKLETCNIDVDKIEEAITPKTKLTGTIGDIGTFSYYPAHFLTMGEGGAVITDDTLLKKIIKSFRDWGRDCWCEPGHDNTCGCRFEQQFGKLPFGYDHKYVYSHFGYNLKITDWQAAIGCAQLEKVDKFIEIRRNNFKNLYSKLSDLKEYLSLPEIEENAEPSWFGFLITLKPDVRFTKQEMVEYLESHGIGTRQLFAGNALRQPMFVEGDVNFRIGNSGLLNSKDLNEDLYSNLPNTDYIMNNTFWVGVFPALGEEEISKISEEIHKFVKGNK